jgi:hypothetical protein
MGRNLCSRSPDRNIERTEQKELEKIFGVMPEYLNNLSIEPFHPKVNKSWARPTPQSG